MAGSFTINLSYRNPGTDALESNPLVIPPVTGDWLIAAPYKVGQKLPLSVVYPRPDGETLSTSIHRKASANWTYSMRVAIQGGEAPFKYEIVSGPVGATIVEEFTRTLDSTGLINHPVPTNYATVFWPSPSGTANWDIKVTDQSGDVVNAVWSTVVDEAAFVYVSTVGGNDSNPGTFASPKLTFANGIWKGSDSDSTYFGKIIAFKAGTYPVYGIANPSNCSINATDKPRSFVGIESGVVLDTSNGHFSVNVGEIAFVNMELSGSRTEGNNRIIDIQVKADNYLFWKVEFSNSTFGTVGGDNPACIFFADEPNNASYNIAVVDCILAPTAEMQLVVTFACDNVLVENNTLLDIDLPSSNGAKAIHIKDDTLNVTVRFNRLTGASADGMIVFSNQHSADSTIFAANQEACYNYINSTTFGPVFPWNSSAVGTAVNAENAHCYRNTVITTTPDAISAQRYNGGDQVLISGICYNADALVSSDTSPVGYSVVSPASVKILATDIDSSGKLNDATGKRTANLGLIGFEIASTGSV